MRFWLASVASCVMAAGNRNTLVESRQRLDQVADMSAAVRLAPQWFPHTYLVVIVAADSAYVDVAGRPQIRKHVGGCPLRQPKCLGNTADRVVPMSGDVDEYRGVIRQKRPAPPPGRFGACR